MKPASPTSSGIWPGVNEVMDEVLQGRAAARLLLRP